VWILIEEVARNAGQATADHADHDHVGAQLSRGEQQSRGLDSNTYHLYVNLGADSPRNRAV
jgi:hypothetical protein